MLRTIVLHGALGAAFGREFRLDVPSVGQAVKALMVQLPGFRAALREGHYRVTRFRRARPFDLDEQMIKLPLGSAEELHFTPQIAGAGAPSRGASTGKIIAGVALVAAAVALSIAAPAGGAFFAATLFGTQITTGMVAAVGIGIALSGIAGLLSKQPTQGNSSFIFGGQDNVSDQGGPVPLVYGGPALTGSVGISAGLFAEALSPGTQPFDPSITPRTVYYSQSG